jgi:hypothetical protein
VIAAALPLVSAASLWAAFQGTVVVSATSRGNTRNGDLRGGATPGAVTTGPTAYDLDAAPSAALAMDFGRTEASFGYTPLFTARNAFDDVNRVTLVLHSGYAGVVHAGRGYRLSLTQGGAIGTQSFTTLVTTPINPSAMPSPTMSRIDVLPPVQTVRTMSSSTVASLGYDLTGRLRSSLSASYTIAGGLGATAQMTLPQNKTAGAFLELDYRLSRAHQFGTGLNFTSTAMSNGFEYLVLAVPLEWTYQLRAGSQLSAGTGVMGIRTIEPFRTPRYTLAITGQGAGSTDLYRKRGMALTAAVGASIAPAVTALTGVMQQRLSGTAALVFTWQRLTVTVNGDGSQSIPTDDPSSYRILGIGASASYSPFELMDLSTGYRSAWQTAQDPRIPSLPRQWNAYVALTLRAPPVRF